MTANGRVGATAAVYTAAILGAWAPRPVLDTEMLLSGPGCVREAASLALAFSGRCCNKFMSFGGAGTLC